MGWAEHSSKDAGGMETVQEKKWHLFESWEKRCLVGRGFWSSRVLADQLEVVWLRTDTKRLLKCR